MCDHGVQHHPLWPDRVIKVGRTWIRSKYVVGLMGKCVQCIAEDGWVAPPDFPYDTAALPQASVPVVQDTDEVEPLFQPMPWHVSGQLPYVEPTP
jgi:hypothetical protein